MRASRWQLIQQLVLTILISSPVVVYFLIAFNADPVLRQWLAQNILTSPHPLHYLIGYGVLLVPALFGWRALHRRSPRLARFVAVWALLLPVLLYLPISTQRRLIEGFQLPLVAVAVLGLTEVWGRWQRISIPAVLLLSLPTTFLLLAGGLNAARTLREPVFVSAERLHAFEWLNENATPGAVALAAYGVSNELPVYTPLVAYIGHGPETVFLAHKQPRVEAFFRSATTDAERLRLLADGRVTYVIHGPAERALGDFDPGTAPYLARVYSAAGYEIYQVERP